MARFSTSLGQGSDGLWLGQIGHLSNCKIWMINMQTLKNPFFTILVFFDLGLIRGLIRGLSHKVTQIAPNMSNQFIPHFRIMG